MSDTDTGAAAAATAAAETTEATGAAAMFDDATTATETGAERAGFLDSLDDTELKTWAENKKFPDLKTAFDSYRNLEKLLGGEKLPVPKGDDDTEGRERFYKALGRPDTPEGYDLGKLEGADEGFATVAAAWLHQAGVGKAQAAKFAEGWNQYVAQSTQARQDAFDAQSRIDVGELKTEWGQNYEANVEHFRRAGRALGLTGDEVKAIELEIGTKRTMSLFSTIGRGIGEGSFIEGEGGKNFKLTAEQAKGRIDALRKDATWQQKWLNGGADEKAEWDRLHKVAYPEQSRA